MEEATFFASNTLSRIAFNAAESSLTASDRNFISALFSAAWLEASLNEIVYDLTMTDEALLDPAIRERVFERLRTPVYQPQQL